MKKNTKFLVLLLAMLLMCLCLTGCDELDEMREIQAFWTTQGSTDSITYNGVEYKKLPGYNNPNPMYNSQYSKYIYVTDRDVPVLLSSRFSDIMDVSDDENFISGYCYTTDYYYSESYVSPDSEAVYCKSDIYDEVVEKINAGIEYTNYGFGYYYWDEKEMTDIWEYYYLSSDETDAVNKVIENVEPITNSEIDYNNNYVLSLDKISEDKYFGKDSFDLYTDGLNTYYLVQYSEALDIHTCYKVPEELKPTFEKLEELVSTNDIYFKNYEVTYE